jgi:peptidoglycan/xylan/chitin deacetylase (PgdA/CDA1 family)
MKSLLVKTPNLVQRMFPKRVWAFPKNTNTVYLTFDDGPIPEITPWILEELRKYKAKATFFCIGDNISKYPEIFKSIISEGHSVGNHTYNHLNGWKTTTVTYVENVLLAEEEIEKNNKVNKNTNRKSSIVNRKSLFRPPYGKITRQQSKMLQKKGYTIVMWDVLSFDFDADISEEKCFSNVSENIQTGSIVVFHDSLKAEKNLRKTLPKVLDYCKSKGWQCKTI